MFFQPPSCSSCFGNGDGTFTPSFTTFDFGKFIFPNLAADVDGDGHADLIELDGLRSSYNVILATAAGPTFQIQLVGDPVVGTTGKGLLTLAVTSASSTSVGIVASDGAITVPSTVTIPAGKATQSFSFTIGPGFNRNHVFSLTAQLGSEKQVAYGTQLGSGTAGFATRFYIGPYTLPDLNLAAGQNSTLQVIATRTAMKRN